MVFQRTHGLTEASQKQTRHEQQGPRVHEGGGLLEESLMVCIAAFDSLDLRDILGLQMHC
jgi:hypothetical protein